MHVHFQARFSVEHVCRFYLLPFSTLFLSGWVGVLQTREPIINKKFCAVNAAVGCNARMEVYGDRRENNAVGLTNETFFFDHYLMASRVKMFLMTP